jgi:hypothetical protein
LLSDEALNSQEDHHTVFDGIPLGIKTAEKEKSLAVMNIVAQISKNMLQLG